MVKIMRLAAGWMLVGTLLVSGSSGIVLCVGDDGHFAVEPVHQGRCGTTSDATGRVQGEAATSLARSAVNGGGNCVDVSLSLDIVLQSARDVTPDRLLKTSFSKDFSAGFAVITFADGHRPRMPAFERPSRLSQALQAQRTIVLRI